MSSNKRHERTGREMYATYRHGHFISGEECEVICLEVPEQKNSTLVTAVSVPLVQGLQHMLIRHCADR